MTPIKCPRCKAGEGNIDNAEDMCELLGLDAIERQNKTWMCGKCNYFFNDDEAEFPVIEYNLEKMTLSQISDLISNSWNNMPEKAYCYVEAMSQIESLEDKYGDYETGLEIVSYFLTNAKTWQGNIAKNVKQHLNNLIRNYKDRQIKEESDQLKKIKNAKTGQPIELTGYAVYDKEGNDTGKRFANKEYAEEYQKELWGIDKN